MTDRLVLDTGVPVRWYVDQSGFEHAREVRAALLAESVEGLMPDQGRIEFAAVLRTAGLRKGRLTRADYLQAIADLSAHRVEVRATSTSALLRAAALAADVDISLYDAVFVELALSEGVPLLTNDARLARAVGGIVSTEVLRGVAAGP